MLYHPYPYGSYGSTKLARTTDAAVKRLYKLKPLTLQCGSTTYNLGDFRRDLRLTRSIALEN